MGVTGGRHSDHSINGSDVDGWYPRKENAEGPPQGWSTFFSRDWNQGNCGQYWYEKGDYYIIQRHREVNAWAICRVEKSLVAKAIGGTTCKVVHLYGCDRPGGPDLPPPTRWYPTPEWREPA